MVRVDDGSMGKSRKDVRCAVPSLVVCNVSMRIIDPEGSVKIWLILAALILE